MGFLSRLLGRDDNIMVNPPAQQMSKNISTQTPNAGDGIMVISDAFSIVGRGTVATGRLTQAVRLNDPVVIVYQDGTQLKSKVIGIEAFRKKLDVAEVGENVGLLLEGIERGQIRRGDIIRLAS
ncbi:MAG: hypothetical protein K5837_04065 [Candidatus Saccharibacteria bacterium]|nr:hypothetical protein [Candidatus Saccharibacteria bacterium]